jgi:hypothetical protein
VSEQSLHVKRRSRLLADKKKRHAEGAYNFFKNNHRCKISPGKSEDFSFAVDRPARIKPQGFHTAG